MHPSVLIEIGHGPLSPKGFDPGSVYHSKVTEYDVNKILSIRLQKRLKALGIQCEVTDRADSLYALGKRRDGYSVFHSVHHNAANGKAQGTEVCVHAHKASSHDRALASALARAAGAALDPLAKALGLSGMPVRHGNGVNDLRALSVLSGACDAKRAPSTLVIPDTAVLTEAYFGDALPLGNHVAWSECAADAYADVYARWFGISVVADARKATAA